MRLGSTLVLGFACIASGCLSRHVPEVHAPQAGIRSASSDPYADAAPAAAFGDAATRNEVAPREATTTTTTMATMATDSAHASVQTQTTDARGPVIPPAPPDARAAVVIPPPPPDARSAGIPPAPREADDASLERVHREERVLAELVSLCVDKRARLAHVLERAERAERAAIGGSVAAYVVGAIAAGRTGTTVVAPPPPNYGPGYRYGVLGPPGTSAPGLHFGARPPGTTGPRLFLRASNPISDRADLVALDGTDLIDAINDEIDASYADLDAARARRTITEEDEAGFADHDARLRGLCEP